MYKIAHVVTCRICKTKFDRDKISYVSPKDRVYNHADCYLRERAKDASLPELKIVDPNDIVTCHYCKKTFNKQDTEYKQILNNKYAHIKCIELEEKREKTDSEKLDLYIMELFGLDYVTPRIRKQINQYMSEYNYSYTGILKALKYFYEIKKNNIDKSQNGIGIVPYIYNDAFNYYYALWLAQQKNENKEQITYKIEEIHIPVPQRKLKKRKLFSFLDEEEESE